MAYRPTGEHVVGIADYLDAVRIPTRPQPPPKQRSENTGTEDDRGAHKV